MIYRLLLLLVMIPICAFGQKVQVEQHLGNVQIIQGDTTHLSFSVTARKDAKITFPQYKVDNIGDNGSFLSEKLQNVEVVEILGGDTITLDDGYVRTTQTYAITSFEPSIYTLDSLMIVVDGKKYCGNKLALKVLEQEIDTTNVRNLCPPKDIKDNPFELAEWLPVIIGIPVIIGLIILGVWLYLRKKKGKPIKIRIRTIKRIPPHEKAINDINAIKQENLTVSEDNKEYYTRLTDALRRYMETRFNFSAMEMTTSEIIMHLQNETDQQKIDELRELFETADLVKFAKHTALINENDRNLMAAVEFINTTKTDEKVTEVREKEQLTEEEQQMRTQNIMLTSLIIIVGVTAIAVAAYVGWRIIELTL